jgi:hypothetical protein
MTSPENGDTDRNADRREWAKLAASEKAANLRLQKTVLGSLAAFTVACGLGLLFMFSDRISTSINHSERPATTTGTATGSTER